MTTKTLKELAFLHDLYIATDWGERFAELVDEHVELPREGRALYVEAGTGGHALALQERAGKKLTRGFSYRSGRLQIVDRHLGGAGFCPGRRNCRGAATDRGGAHHPARLHGAPQEK